MIVSDRFGFVFIHIPKCAGTSVREALRDFQEAAPQFLEKVGHHPVYGRIDFTHLPLNVLADIAPTSFEKLRTYETYAIVRDPMQRFQSAVSQHVKVYKKRGIAQFDRTELEAEINNVISYLLATPQVINPEFIHFSRQSDFVFFGEEQLIQNIYALDRLGDLAQAIAERTGTLSLTFGHENKTRIFRYQSLKEIAQISNQHVKRFMPGPIHRWIRQSARGVMMKPRDKMILPAFRTKAVQTFVNEYYAKDYVLHHKALLSP